MKLEQVIKEHVLRTLEEVETISKAADILGVSDRTVRNYLQSWGVTTERQEKQRAALKRAKEDERAMMRNLTKRERDEYENRNRY